MRNPNKMTAYLKWNASPGVRHPRDSGTRCRWLSGRPTPGKVMWSMIQPPRPGQEFLTKSCVSKQIYQRWPVIQKGGAVLCSLVISNMKLEGWFYMNLLGITNTRVSTHRAKWCRNFSRRLLWTHQWNLCESGASFARSLHGTCRLLPYGSSLQYGLSPGD